MATTPGQRPPVPETTPQRDGQMAAMQMVRDVLVGRPPEAFESFAGLPPEAAGHALGYLAGRYVAMCRLYAHLLMITGDVDEELLEQLAASDDPRITGPIDEAVRAMIENDMAAARMSKARR